MKLKVQLTTCPVNHCFPFSHLIKNKVIRKLKKLNMNHVNIWNIILSFHCVNLSNTASVIPSLTIPVAMKTISNSAYNVY